MDTTVAVALITSISTLAGGGISGYLTFLVSRSNNRTQAKLTKDSLLDRREADRRQLRRTAYVQYLNQLSSAEQALEAAWTAPVPVGAAEHINLLKACSSAVNKLVPFANMILLEGPANVSSAVLVLGVRLTLETACVVQVAGSPTGRGPLCLSYEELYKKAKLDRGKAKDAVVKAARQALSDSEDIDIGSYYPKVNLATLKAEVAGWQNVVQRDPARQPEAPVRQRQDGEHLPPAVDT